MFAPHVSKPLTKAVADSTTTSRTTARGLRGNSVTAAKRKRGLTFDFSKISVDLPGRANRPQSSLSAPCLPGTVQAKLVVGEVNDPLEYEADRVADQVMRMPNPDLSISATPLQSSPKDTLCKTEVAKTSQAGRGESVTAVGSEFPSIAENVIRSPGRSLDPCVRDFMESRFSRDFSQVRVHDDEQSANAAHAVSARAFTAGSHIVFAEPLDKSSDQGRRLLAHELAHVAQQATSGRGSGPVLIQREGASTAPARPQMPQLPQVVAGLLQRTEEGRWALNVMRTNGVTLILSNDKNAAAAYYRAKDNSCTLNTSLAPEVVASYFVHEMYHAERKATGKTGDPRKMQKEEYVKTMVEEEIQGTVRGYTAHLELEKKGQLPPNASFPPRFDFFRSAYNTGRDLARKANAGASEPELHRAGLSRAEAAIRYFVKERGLGPFAGPGGLGITYGEYYSADWEKAHSTSGVTH